MIYSTIVPVHEGRAYRWDKERSSRKEHRAKPRKGREEKYEERRRRRCDKQQMPLQKSRLNWIVEAALYYDEINSPRINKTIAVIAKRIRRIGRITLASDFPISNLCIKDIP